MASSDGASSISVTVRVRPFTIREAAQLTKTDDGPLFLGDGSLAAAPQPKLSQRGIRPVIKVVDEKCLVFDPPEDNPVTKFTRNLVPTAKRTKDQTFAFDRVFDDNTTQADVYEATTKNLLDSVLDGYNATVFAYGATGCGKTHTITGTAQQPGIIFLTMQELFERIADIQGDKVTEISLSYLEIYNETIRDLLVVGGSKAGLMLREDAHQTVSVAGLSSHHPVNVEEVMEMIVRGNEYRTMSPTEANATSSRSHAVLQINVSTKDRNADINEPHTMATLSIIDLAGSERASATKNRGERLIEGANINKSLLALGSCINALCDPRKKNHVPYRNSKLTRLLKFSLGGNCKTVMIVCVSPSSVHYDETQNTLRYANRAKNIQTKVTRNVYNVNRHVKDFLKKIDEQMQLINELKAQQKDYEGTAFVKFKKLSEKREVIAREGILRIRSAYEHSTAERQERITGMRKLRQIEKRISLLESWQLAFDNVCESREDEEPPKALVAMRRTAQGIQAEMEASRQHYHQRLGKNNWERAIDTALQTGIRQLQDLDGPMDSRDSEALNCEAELWKARADREAHASLLEQEKAGDTALVQVLLHAHFETIGIINQIMQMDEEEAVKAARKVLGKLMTSCSEAASQVVKPDGGLPVTEAFPPMKGGTPKRRKAANLLGPSPVKPRIPVMESDASLIYSSPVRPSPRRRVLGSARKGISVTPKKKKSPVKGLKRGVRWRDDTEEGALAEYQKTPQKLDSTPELPSSDIPVPTLPAAIFPPTTTTSTMQQGSSPIPSPPEVSFETKSRATNRFQAGFLSKKLDGSPNALPGLTSSSSDSDTSPLREMPANSAPRKSSLAQVTTIRTSSSPSGDENANANTPTSSDTENNTHNMAKKLNTNAYNHRKSLSIAENWKSDPASAQQISAAVRRASSVSSSRGANGVRQSIHRRRSPSASATGSPPSSNAAASGNGNGSGGEGAEKMLTASAARRMGARPERVGEMSSVLSPRTAPVLKRESTAGAFMGGSAAAAARRTTMGTMGPPPDRDGSLSMSAQKLHHSGRVSSVMPGSASRARTVWR